MGNMYLSQSFFFNVFLINGYPNTKLHEPFLSVTRSSKLNHYYYYYRKKKKKSDPETVATGC